jgi:hypothetical protein
MSNVKGGVWRDKKTFGGEKRRCRSHQKNDKKNKVELTKETLKKIININRVTNGGVGSKFSINIKFKRFHYI